MTIFFTSINGKSINLIYLIDFIALCERQGTMTFGTPTSKEIITTDEFKNKVNFFIYSSINNSAHSMEFSILINLEVKTATIIHQFTIAKLNAPNKQYFFIDSNQAYF